MSLIKWQSNLSEAKKRVKFIQETGHDNFPVGI
jgi:hypothetical protein